MSIHLQGRVAVLEAEVKRLNEVITGLIDVMTTQAEPRNGNGPRQMCPKCGVKPNYFLHVKSCKGAKQEAAI